MSEPIAKGTWVEIQTIVLPPEQRAPQVPDDTRQVALELRVKGYLTASASIGENAEIVTAAGRHVHGALTVSNPPYTHGFGPPIPELSNIGSEARRIVSELEQPE